MRQATTHWQPGTHMHRLHVLILPPAPAAVAATSPNGGLMETSRSTTLYHPRFASELPSIASVWAPLLQVTRTHVFAVLLDVHCASYQGLVLRKNHGVLGRGGGAGRVMVTTEWHGFWITSASHTHCA